MNINRLVICEIFPEEDFVNTSTVLKESALELSVQQFFEKHVDNIYKSTGTRSGRFNNFNSTSFKTFQSMLSLSTSTPYFSPESLKMTRSKIEKIHNNDSEILTNIDVEFFAHSETLTRELLKNIQKSIKQEFLLVIFHCEHDQHGELIAVLKMEKVAGVQYVQGDLKAQLNLLPSHNKALQKGALIFKKNLVGIPLDELQYRGNTNEEIFHTKFRDTQDDTIAKYFMTGFLDNVIINRDKENTVLAKKQISVALLPFLNEENDKKDIISYIEKSYSPGVHTSISNIVEKTINESNLINIEKLNIANVDYTSLSNNIYEKMLDSNPTASSDFKIDFHKIDKLHIRSKEDKGKLLNFSIAKTLELTGTVIIGASEIDEEYYYIGIKKDFYIKS